MSSIFHRSLAVLLCLGILVPGLISPVRATQTEETEPQIPPTEKVETPAQDISRKKYMTEYSGFGNCAYLFDGKEGRTVTTGDDASFTVEYAGGVGSVYIIFQKTFGAYRVTDNDTGTTVTVGEENFLHDFLDMWELFGRYPSSVTVNLSGKPAYLNELSFYTPGQVPDSVQKWELPRDGETDLVLFSTHGDDEQLFFAGILPYYDAELGYQVQVVYFTDHHNNSTIRQHEMLNGLWAVGVTTYPVFGYFEDFRRDDIDAVYSRLLSYGHSKEELLGYVVEQIRRFRPKVVVGHDFNGEYGHGQHKVYADLLAQSLELSNDPEAYPELAEKYGLWDVPKAYFHLYKENEIIMDWDQPLERFNGETAFEVSIYRGFQCHKSQVREFTWYYTGYPNAISLRRYNPCYYGLYRTTVGPDVEKNDFFENVTTHAEDYRIEQERLEQERLEQERLERERQERERQEQERLEQERREQERLEAERKAAQAAKDQTEREAARLRTRKQRMFFGAVAAAGIVLACFLMRILRRELKKGKKK